MDKIKAFYNKWKWIIIMITITILLIMGFVVIKNIVLQIIGLLGVGGVGIYNTYTEKRNAIKKKYNDASNSDVINALYKIKFKRK